MHNICVDAALLRTRLLSCAACKSISHALWVYMIRNCKKKKTTYLMAPECVYRGDAGSPANPFSKDAACPGAAVRERQFDSAYRAARRGPGTKRPVECGYLTFNGPGPNAEVPVKQRKPNPLLPNANELTGALVSSFDPSNQRVPYTDQRVITAKAADGPVANPQAQVRAQLLPRHDCTCSCFCEAIC